MENKNLAMENAKPQITQEEANELWRHLFHPKIDRLAERLKRFRSYHKKVLFLKICYMACNEVQSRMAQSDNPYFTALSKKLWPLLDDQEFYHYRRRCDRIVRWYHRIGLDLEIWRRI